MIRAYDEQYLDDAMKNLGEAMDYAVYSCHMEMDRFMELFIATGLAEQFGAGVPGVVSGMSGTELVMEVIQKSGTENFMQEAQTEYECSAEYWCGWILAYYQWYTGRSFKNIGQCISMKRILELYPTLHEAAEERFVDTVNHMIEKSNPPTRLQMLRKAAGYSQQQLAEKSGVGVRSIQQYEQRVKDINRAAASKLQALAQTLGCKMEDLMEYYIQKTV